MNVSYNWLKEYIGVNAPTAKEVEGLLNKHAFEIEEFDELENDTVIDVDILPNRSSDCLCHRGVAKEIAVLTGRGLDNDPLAEKPALPATDLIDVNIEDSTKCRRFTATLITGIEVKDSPQWLKDRLEAIGQRPINNIVDATNYVMFAMGQPLHAYDAERFPQVDGKWQFGVRTAKEGEVVSLLAEGGKDEDREVELKGTELLIVDESSNTPIGLAGVKGGRFAGVHEKTTQIIVEAANFEPALTRTTARGLGIVIDASKRFENEPSRELPIYGQAEIIKLIKDIAGGESQGTIDLYPEPEVKTEVRVRKEKVNALLGLDLDLDKMVEIVELIGAKVVKEESGFVATSPFERTDLDIEEDYIEEIGRIYGYDHVESVIPEPVPLKEMNVRHYYSDAVREVLLEVGFNEVITSSFRKKDELKLANALASDKGYMRSSLRKNIETALVNNVSHLDLIGAQDVRVFEIGTVFSYNKDTKKISQHTSLTLGVQTKHSGYTPKDDKKLEEGIEQVKSVLGEDNLFEIKNGIAELNLTEALENLPIPDKYNDSEKSIDVVYKPFSQYPAMARDIALWVTEGVTAAEVESVLNENAGELRSRTDLFDEFSKDGRTSFAFRLVFQSYEKTLTDEEVNALMDDVNNAVADKGWEVR